MHKRENIKSFFHDLHQEKIRPFMNKAYLNLHFFECCDEVKAQCIKQKSKQEEKQYKKNTQRAFKHK